jgi:PAS domain S-box-containing protein
MHEQLNGSANAAAWLPAQMVMEMMPHGIVKIDVNGRITFCNRRGAERYGYRPEELLGKAIWDFGYTDRDQQDIHARFHDLLRTQPSPAPYCGSTRDRDGQLVEIQADWDFIRDRIGAIVGVLAVVTDISDRKQAERELQQQKEQLQAVFDHTPVMVALFDREKHLVMANRQWEQTLGWSVEEARSLDILAECYPDPRERARLRQSFLAGSRQWTEFRMRTRDGRSIDTTWAHTVLRDGSTFGFGQDITSKKQAEDALKASEQRYRDLVEMSSDMIYVYCEGKFVFLNQAGCKLLGCATPQDLIGRPLLDVVHKDYHQLIRDRARQLHQGHAVPPAQEKLLRMDGCGVDVEVMGTPFSHDGKPAVHGVARDITARIQAEQERETVVALLKLINTIEDDRQLLKAAAALVKDRLQCDAVGIRLRSGDDYPYAAAEGFAAGFVQKENSLCAANCETRQGHLIHECVCGAVITGQVDSAKPFFTASGSFWTSASSDLVANNPELAAQTRGQCVNSGYQSVALIPLRLGADRMGLLQVNDRRKGFLTRERVAHLEQLAATLAMALARLRARETLWQSEKLAATGRMAASIAHEINNPLAGIKNAFQLLKDAIPENHPYYAFGGRIEREIDRIGQIVRQMYDCYRPAQEKPRPFFIGECIHDVVLLLQSLCRQKEVTVDERVEPDLPPVTLAEAQLRQVLFNVIRNAIEAAPPQSVVTVAATVAHGKLTITVSDQGPGVPAHVGQKVFEPFFTTKTGISGGGLGLGLAVSRSLVQAMGGSLTFENRATGGAAFSIVLHT